MLKKYKTMKTKYNYKRKTKPRQKKNNTKNAIHRTKKTIKQNTKKN